MREMCREKTGAADKVCSAGKTNGSGKGDYAMSSLQAATSASFSALDSAWEAALVLT